MYLISHFKFTRFTLCNCNRFYILRSVPSLELTSFAEPQVTDIALALPAPAVTTPPAQTFELMHARTPDQRLIINCEYSELPGFPSGMPRNYVTGKYQIFRRLKILFLRQVITLLKKSILIYFKIIQHPI